MLGFTGVIAIGTAILFGVVPAVRASRVPPIDAMKEHGRGTTSGHRVGLAGSLVMAQVALSLVLLVSAGLFVGTFRNLSNVDPGFSPNGILLMDVDLRRTGLTGDALTTSLASLVNQINEMDGFSTAGGVAVSFTGPIDIRGIATDPLADPPAMDPVLDADDYKKPGAPIVLVDVDPESPEQGQARGIVPRWWAQAKDGYYTADEFTLLAQPSFSKPQITRALMSI
jgi:hypothetical protein